MLQESLLSDNNAVAESKIQKLQDKLPIVDKCLATVLLIMNIFFPGWGTMLCGCLKDDFVWINLVIGLIQFFTSFFLYNRMGLVDLVGSNYHEKVLKS